MKTSRHLKQLSIEDELTSLRGDFLANPLAQQDLEKERKMTATYGRRCLESFGKFPRATLWAKTFAAYLIGQGDWYSSKCALTWKMKATKSHRIYFQLAVKTHPTEGIEFGLLPTVTSQVRERTLEECQDRQEKYGGKKRALYLDHFAAMGMLPTPTTIDAAKNGDMTGAAKMLKGANKRASGQQIQKTLSDAVQMEYLKDKPNLTEQLAKKDYVKRTLLPLQSEIVEWLRSKTTAKKLANEIQVKMTTVEHWFRKDKSGFSYPSVEEWNLIAQVLNPSKDMTHQMTYQEKKNWTGMLPTPLASEGGKMSGGPTENQMSLSKMARQQTGKTSQLNPLFVEEMMGFPENWTALPFQSGEKKVSKPTETP